MAEKKQPLMQSRFSYPANDETTKEWLAAQCNPSISIRLLINRYVKESGFTDVTGLSLGGD